MTQRDYNAREVKLARKAFRGLPCWRCRKPSDTVGHVPPLSSFPPGQWVGRLLPECAKCNYAEGGRLSHEVQARRRANKSRRW